MTFPATRWFATEITVYQCPDFCLGLGQRHDVGACIQLALSVAADDFVLSEGKPLGVSLIHRRNLDIRFLQWVEHIDVAKIAWIERELNFRSQSCSPP